MSGFAYQASRFIPVSQSFLKIDASIILYGLFADLFMIGPLLAYLVTDDTLLYSQYHQTYINLLFSSYAPLGISWWIVAFSDS